MTADDLSFVLDKQEMKRTKLKRCALCGRDKEILFAQVLKINSKTFNRLKEIATEFSELTIIQQMFYFPEIDGVIDDLTLKPIDGTGFQVSFRMCQECLHKIAWRHKYKSKHIFNTA